MQSFKKEIAAEVCRRQDVPNIVRACDKEMTDDKKFYKEQMKKVTQKQADVVQLTQQEQALKIVKALEEQMKILPQSIYDILVQFDE